MTIARQLTPDRLASIRAANAAQQDCHELLLHIEWLAAESVKLKRCVSLVANSIRDQANRYARTKLQSDDDELQRLIRLFNLPDDQLIARAKAMLEESEARP